MDMNVTLFKAMQKLIIVKYSKLFYNFRMIVQPFNLKNK